MGAIRDSIADHLFPGTSTIQTRLRYMLFIPWLFQMLEGSDAGPAELAGEARALENRLANSLKAGGETNGIIGRDAGPDLLRLPSSVYWSGLGTWGIRLFPGSTDHLFSSIRYLQRRQAPGSDDAVMEGRGEAANFRLTSDEAEFVVDRLVAQQPRSLLAFLARSGGAGADCRYIWEHPNLADFPQNARAVVGHGETFADVMHGASLLYNLLLSDLREMPEWSADYRTRLQQWREGLDMPAIRGWSLDTFWQAIDHPAHRIRPAAKKFVADWLSLVRSEDIGEGSQASAALLVADRERRLKAGQSRFANRAVRDRWTGASGVERLSFRWNQAKSHLRDIANAD